MFLERPILWSLVEVSPGETGDKLANLEVRLEQEVGGMVEAPFSGIFKWCPVQTPQSQSFSQEQLRNQKQGFYILAYLSLIHSVKMRLIILAASSNRSFLLYSPTISS